MKREDRGQPSDIKFRQISRFKNSPSNRANNSKLWIALAAVLVAAVFFAFGKKTDPNPFFTSSVEPEKGTTPPLSETVSPAVADPEPKEIEPGPADHNKTIEVKLKKGDSLFDILMKEGIPPLQISELVDSARRVHNLSRLKQNQIIAVDYDERDGRVIKFETDIDNSNRMVVERDGEKLLARKEAYEFETNTEVISGTINDSLFLAANEAGLPSVLILELAEIFAWDIDFHVDMRRGDSFQVLYEKKFLDGDFAHLGRITAAAIVNQNKPLWAFYFKGENGKSDYYDRKGRSLRKAFLKSPLKYRRISSGFSYRRFHPILKTYRPHLGVDYAAPTGTLVRTIGDGRIAYGGWKKGFGRYIEVRHNDTYTSTYGHLQRLAKGIRKGKYVEQGQVIGYVGSTGLATGPHLDFRLLKNGSFINPLKVNFPDADPVKEEDMPEFKRQVEELLAEIQRTAPQKKITDSSFQDGTSRQWRLES